MREKFGSVGIGLLGGLALVLVLAFFGGRFIKWPYTFQGSLIDPPVPAAEIQLFDQNGQPFRLSDQRGKLVLIFFGYTSCPDVCPVTLSQLKQIKQQLGNRAQNVRVVFITVDPERDTAQRLGSYLNSFDPSFIGLTGSLSELQSVWKSYGVYVAKDTSGNAADYQVDHTARIYAIDGHGNWRLTYPFGIETSSLLQDVAHLLQED